ncbi:MAG TPA: glycosyltransferase [Polyangiaceae bacterium]
MKILFVTPFLPSPPRFGGQRRLDGLMRSLAVNHELTVISFNASDPFNQLSLEATQAYCREVITFPDMEFLDGRDKRRLQARSMLSRHSFEYLLLARRREFQARLQQLVQSGRFDIVQVEFAQMAAFSFKGKDARRTRTVLDEHNIEFDIVKRTASADVGAARRVYSAVDWRKLRREERAAWRRFDGVSVTSERDAGILRKLEPRTKVSVVPNGVDIEQFRPGVARCERDSLLFFGAINYYPNHDGIMFFIEQVYPLILARRPKTKLWIVGPVGDDMKQLNSENIQVEGFVDQVEPYLDRATAVIAPLRIGGGTRLKIVEAMSKAKPIVSTRIGAEGLDVAHGKHVLLADEPQDFADEVERVLADEELAASLGRAARELAEERYSWTSLVKTLERFYDELLMSPPKQA